MFQHAMFDSQKIAKKNGVCSMKMLDFTKKNVVVTTIVWVHDGLTHPSLEH